MKILKNGKLKSKSKQTEIIYKHTCDNCGCVFECNKYELDVVRRNETIFNVFDMKAKEHIIEREYKTINCPYCKSTQIIDYKKN